MTTDSIETKRAAYEIPVSRLLTIGVPTGHVAETWLDYQREFGLGPDHIHDLIRMASDESLNQSADADYAVWAPLHAWRALGRLRAVDAVRPLIALMALDDDYVTSDIPIVLGMIGPPALEPVLKTVADRETPYGVTLGGLDTLKEIAKRHPECREASVSALTAFLKRRLGAKRALNGFAISALLDLDAVESIDVIRDAFARDAVDISIPGDLEEVEIALGLRETRATPAPFYPLQGFPPIGRSDTAAVGKVGRNDPCPCGSGKKYKKCCLESISR